MASSKTSFSSELVTRLDSLRDKLEAETVGVQRPEFWQFLIDSESLLIEVMEGKSPEEKQPGRIEFGLGALLAQ